MPPGVAKGAPGVAMWGNIVAMCDHLVAVGSRFGTFGRPFGTLEWLLVSLLGWPGAIVYDFIYFARLIVSFA